MEKAVDFDQLFRDYYERLFFYAYHHLQEVESSRDVVHDAFEYVWRHRGHIDLSHAKSYLYTIVHSRCIDLLRRHLTRQDYLVHLEETLTVGTTQEEIELYEEQMRCLRQAIQLLTPLTRRVLESCYLHRKSYKEVAEELGCSVSAVQKHIVKALRLMRKEMKNRNFDR